MLSRVIIAKRENGRDVIIRHWDITQIRNNDDALQVRVGDVLEYKEVSFRVTYCGNARNDSHRAWCARMFGGKERYGLDDNSVVAIGRDGMADNFNSYENGKFYDFCLGKGSYLWTGD